MTQFLRPDADVDAGLWTAAPLWSKLDETLASDVDFVSSDNNTAPDTFEVALSDPGGTPDVGAVTLRVRRSKSATGGHALAERFSLYQGTTLIEELAQATPDSTAWATVSLAIANRAAISDWSDLRVRVAREGATGGGPSGRRSLRCSWIELEAPNNAAPPEDHPTSSAVTGGGTSTSTTSGARAATGATSGGGGVAASIATVRGTAVVIQAGGDPDSTVAGGHAAASSPSGGGSVSSVAGTAAQGSTASAVSGGGSVVSIVGRVAARGSAIAGGGAVSSSRWTDRRPAASTSTGGSSASTSMSTRSVHSTITTGGGATTVLSGSSAAAATSSVSGGGSVVTVVLALEAGQAIGPGPQTQRVIAMRPRGRASHPVARGRSHG